MKQPNDQNRLCLSCFRHCKQKALAIVASCPSYNPRPNVKCTVWKQLELKL